MKMRLVPILCFAVLCMAVLACEGGTSGSVVNSSQTCRSSGDHVECEGKFGKLSGTYGEDIEDATISSTDTIDVEMYVTVESGSVQVSVQGPGGEVTSVQAGSNQPATLVGVAEGDFESFKVTFEALDDQATNIRYTISYWIR